jgi:amidophosphoribosyltransferase
MCGIVVGLAFGKLNQRDEAMRQRLLRYFTTELLVATEERGKDATGAAVLFNDGKYMGLKRGEKVSEFLSVFGETKDCYGSLLKVWREHPSQGRIYLGHCRAGTTGDKEDNENNHPIKIGNLIGIHNGVIRNHDTIFKNLGCKRDGKVDSEAIFRLFEYYTQKGKEPFTMKMLQDVVDRLDGQFAVTLFNADNLEQVPIFRDGRPVEFVLIRRYGILLMVSESKFWNRIYFRYERMVNDYAELLSVNLPSFLDDGEIITKIMPDDTAIMFDLSRKVGKDTEIEDLGESQKMVRNSKLWQAKTTTTYYNRTTSYNNWSNNKSDVGIAKKRRVFDKIKKQFVVKVGDKDLDSKKSTTIPVDDDKKVETVKEDEATKKVEDIKGSTDIAKTDTIEKKDGSKESGFRKDGEKEESSSTKVEVKDHTTYDVDKNASENSGKDEDIIDIPPEDIEVIKTPEPSLIEVEMTTYSPEIVEAANKAYESIPTKSKGCGDLEELLDILDLESKEKAESLGMALMGNRALKHGWLQGYMYAMKSLPKSVGEKDIRRESHIAGLKSLVVLLAGFYEKSKSSNNNSALNKLVQQRLAQVALDNNRRIDVERITKIFNSHEKKLLEDINSVVSQARSVIKDD